MVNVASPLTVTALTVTNLTPALFAPPPASHIESALAADGFHLVNGSAARRAPSPMRSILARGPIGKLQIVPAVEQGETLDVFHKPLSLEEAISGRVHPLSFAHLVKDAIGSSSLANLAKRAHVSGKQISSFMTEPQQTWRANVRRFAVAFAPQNLLVQRGIQLNWAASIMAGELKGDGSLVTNNATLDRGAKMLRLAEILSGYKAPTSWNPFSSKYFLNRFGFLMAAGFSFSEVSRVMLYVHDTEIEYLQKIGGRWSVNDWFEIEYLWEETEQASQGTSALAEMKAWLDVTNALEVRTGEPILDRMIQNAFCEAQTRSVTSAYNIDRKRRSEYHDLSMFQVSAWLAPKNRTLVNRIWQELSPDDRRLLSRHPIEVLNAIELAQGDFAGESSAPIARMTLGMTLRSKADEIRKRRA
ncbi:MAG: hypothetical protein HY540_01040 [Deltaproteobacteria bacterium]|nr:hypothetical protein [Deltaproteobacteria bacterium]